ncbi:MAG: AAA family ATPase [Deltaproteobacteria bacterium]|nr:AAA family ATPase [Deltaproteobacteria bacterium]
MDGFIGRREELNSLRGLLDKNMASFVVIRGRRRIGKSRLSEEFGKSFNRVLVFTGLPPEKGVTAQTQQEEFKRRLHELKIPHFARDDWGDLFKSLADACQRGRVLIILDEISWMGMKSPGFLGKLKNTWDLHLKKNPKLVLLVSGSQSTWIEKNILNHTGFIGRISHQLTLKELSLEECNLFWGSKRDRISSYEKLKILSVTGGIPRYLEEIQTNLSAEENIRRLCFKQEGLLFNEFDQVFSDLFSKRSGKYKEILRVLVKGKAKFDDILTALDQSKGGDISNYLNDLCQTGFVTRDYTWDVKTTQPSKLSEYRLSDNYIRFYLKHIEPNKQKIISRDVASLPTAWSVILGLQFENLVLSPKNRTGLYRLLDIPENEVIWANPYFQTQRKSQKKCQIDLMIQTKYNTLYLCEIKFKNEPLDKAIIQEVEEKRKRLKIPKGFSIRPALIHVNGVSESLIEQDYFAKIISYDCLLETTT